MACPQLYCKNCAEKMRIEHGHQIFADGCPVCLKLCCCADKSVYCQRSHHCYRKCPVSKSGVCSSNVPPSMSPRVMQMELCTPSSSTSKEASQEVAQTCPEAIASSGPQPPAGCDSLDLLAAACAQLAEIPAKSVVTTAVLEKTAIACSTSSETSSEDVSDLSSSSSGEDDRLKKQKRRVAKRKNPLPSFSLPISADHSIMHRQQQPLQLYQQQLATLQTHTMSSVPPLDWTTRAWPGSDIYRTPTILLPTPNPHYRANPTNAHWWAASSKSSSASDTLVWIPTLLTSSDVMPSEPSKRARTLSPEEISAMIAHQQRLQQIQHHPHPLSSVPGAFARSPQLHQHVLMATHRPTPGATVTMPITVRHGYGLPSSVAAAAASSLPSNHNST